MWNSLHSKAFIKKHKTSPTAFLRHRKLPFHDLALFLIGNLKSSYNRELDRFFHQIQGGPISCSNITKPAISAARKNLSPDVFLDLNDQAVSVFEQETPLHIWNGFRLLAIDGTTLRLPDVEPIKKHFGFRSGGKGIPCPLARMSELYDPLNKLTISSVVSPIKIGEREQASSLLLHLMPNDLVLLDRGYPAFSLFKIIHEMNGQFCARMTSHWKIVKNFLESGMPAMVVELAPSPSAVKECTDMELDETPIRIRLIRIELLSGETEILATSLIDPEKYPYDLFSELYHQRWFVEEDYKVLKVSMEIENFSGKTVHSIYQDCYAQVLAKNIALILSFEARNQIKQDGKRRKYVHQINFAYALSKTKEVMARLFYSTGPDIKQLLETLRRIYLKITEPIRPGRRWPRNHRIFKRVYYWNRKCVA